jgi:nitrate reductase NapAB chaperone NapD
MQTRILAIIGINFVFAQQSHAADSTKQASGKLIITVKGEGETLILQP